MIFRIPEEITTERWNFSSIIQTGGTFCTKVNLRKKCHFSSAPARSPLENCLAVCTVQTETFSYIVRKLISFNLICCS